jgi:hypothetical protein
MKRLASIIAATTAAAAVAAAISLPAGADSGAKASLADELATFTSCLRAHGLAVPEGLDPVAFKMWMRDHENSAGFQAAIAACEPDKPAKASGPAPEELVACLREHGLTPPSTIDQLKPWTAQQDAAAAGRAALSACGIDSRPVDKARGDGPCGGDKPTVVEKAKAARAKVAPGI